MKPSSILAGLLLCGLLVAAAPARDGDGPSAAASPARVVFVERVSGVSPFDEDCGQTGGGEAIPDSEVEPHLSVDPTDPDHLVATWQQDRHSDGGARSTLVAGSRDGGATWTTSTLPGLSRCTDPQSERARASDPWTAIGADGVAYQTAMPVLSPEGEADADITVTASTDGGTSWPQPRIIAADDGTFWHEKSVMTADPVHPGRVFVAWARHLLPDPAPLDVAQTADVAMAFSRSDDGGTSWSEPAVIPPNVPGMIDWPWGIVAVPTTTGVRLVVVFSQVTNRAGFGPATIHAVHSDDLGETWSPPSLVGTVANTIPTGDPERVQSPVGGVGTAEEIISLAAGPDGTVYASWYERTATGGPLGGTKLHVARSRDGGALWTTHQAADLPHQAYLPVVALAGDGTVGVTFYDLRHDELGDEQFTADLQLRYSRDEGDTWHELHVAGPFDLRRAPDDGRYFLGDYHGLVGLPKGFGALFAAPPPLAQDGPSDIFYARIQLHPRTR